MRTRSLRIPVLSSVLFLTAGCAVGAVVGTVWRNDLLRLGATPEEANHVWLHLLLLVGLLTLANFFLVRWFVRRWIEPVRKLTRQMEEVKVGRLAAVTEDDRQDEIGDLGRYFNAMIDGIGDARRQSMELARKQANIEKYAALGRLSAGVAHEINNPVGGILTCLETLKELDPGSERYQDYLNLVRSGLERIGKIVKQLLRFSRQTAEESERSELDLNALLKEVMALSLFHNLDQHVEVALRFGDLPPVLGTPDLLNQLFLNLVLNALQAMPSGGSIVLTTWADGDHVLVSLEDTGDGIPEENLDSIFEPFFTTKEVGVGTGLGLSVALGIVEAHGGEIRAENLLRGGARFTVSIPCGVQAPEESAVATEQPA